MGTLSDQDWSRAGAALRTAGALADPAELHGEFCGLACLMGRDAVSAWTGTAFDQAAMRPAEAVAALEQLAETTWCALETGDMSFDLLLPPERESLAARAESLGIWCQGFIHGLGLAGGAGPESPVTGKEAIREIVSDFSEITRAAFTADETEEEGEAALMELVEYVRVSVQLVFEELHALRTGASGSGTH